MKVSLVVPVYNESQHLETFLKELDRLELAVDKELIFVDDCSKDNSWEILSRFTFQSKVILERQAISKGKGAALRLGFQLATGDIIGVQDADFEYSLDDIPAVIDSVIKGKADVAFGSRFKPSGIQVHRTFHYGINRILTILSNVLSGLYLSDMETCYKFFKSEILKNINLESDRFGFEPEITAKIARLKVRAVEIPISYFPRSYIEGKKITWKDGLAAVRHILYFNLVQSESKFFKPDMPKKYIPQGRQLL